jgi:hypothetical protein
MLSLTLEPIDQYDFSNLSGYQLVNQGILYLLYYHYIHTLMNIVVKYLL